MSIQSIKQHKKWLVPAAILLTVAGLFVARTAFARIMPNTIDPQAVVTDNGRRLIATVRSGCTGQGGSAVLEVTVTQRSTGAVAQGRTWIACSGVIQPWEVHATTQGQAAFEEGDATAVALARTSSDGADAHQWLVNITLVTQ
jgi:hypothetical protein